MQPLWPERDVHTHRRRGEGDAIVQVMAHAPEAFCPGFRWQSAGVHPWYTAGLDLSVALDWVARMAAEPEVLAVGEAGLDRLRGGPWALQCQVFEAHVRISERVAKPLIVHCVRAHHELIQWRRRWKPVQPWIIHGYAANAQTAAALVGVGCMLGFGRHLWGNGPAAQVLAGLEEGQYLLETDDADVDIGQVYARAASLRGITPAALCDQQVRLWQQIFGV